MTVENPTETRAPEAKTRSQNKNLKRGGTIGPGRGHFKDPAKAAESAEIKDLSAYARTLTRPAVEKIHQLMTSATSQAVQLQAAELLLERGWAKAVQPVLELPTSVDVRTPLTRLIDN